MAKYVVYDYKTGEKLVCEPTAELVRPTPCGAADMRTIYVALEVTP